MYLNGIHLTLESWRPRKDKDGWPSEPESIAEDNAMLDIMEEEAWRSAVNKPELEPAMKEPGEVDQQGGPASGFVAAVPWLGPDLEAILSFLETESPIMVMAQPAALSICLACGFGYASGEGYAN